MSAEESISFGSVMQDAPVGFTSTMALGWIDGLGTRDAFGDIQPLLCQKWIDPNGGNSSFVWVPVPFYSRL